MSNVICVVTNSKEFRDLLTKSGYSEGTLKSIVYEYLNNKQYQEAGRAWPSDEYVLNYFIKKFTGSPAQVSVWGKRYNSPHVYSSYQDAKAAKEEAMTWFNDSDVYIYENNDHSWTMRVSRPLDAKEINKQSKAWLRDIQNTVNELINSGVSGRYIQTGNKIHDDKTQPALNSLGKILDNFFLRRGLKVQAKWSKARQKWIVSYADEEKPFIDDWDDVNDTNYIWNEGQQNAINTVVDFLNDHRPDAGQFIRINGKAGTGKTSIINEILSRYNAPRSGKTPIVLIGALAHKAKHVLDIKVSEANKKKYRVVPKSIAGMLGLRETGGYYNEKGEQVKKGEGKWFETFFHSKNEELDGKTPIAEADIVIIDEASMVGEEYWGMIKENLSPNTKVIFLGDKGQLPPIRDAKSLYYGVLHKELLNSEADSPVWTEPMPEVTLTERVRQGEDNPLHEITDMYWNFSQGLTSDRPSLIGKTIDENDYRVILEPRTNVAEQSLDLFREATSIQDPNLVKIIAPKNDQVNSYNKQIHFLLHPELQNLPDAEAIMPVKGEIVTMYKNLYKYNPRTKQEELVMANGDDGIVLAKGGLEKDDYGVLSVSYYIKKDDGETAEFSVLLNTTENMKRYDEILAALKLDSQVKNGTDEGTRAYAIYSAYKNKYGDLRLGYATTVHKSQGSTYQTAFVDTEGMFGASERAKAQMMYTALTRASNITVVSGGGSRVAPSSSEIAQANTALRVDRESKGQPKQYGLSQEQIDSIHAESDALTQIIKEALVTTAKKNIESMPDIFSIKEENIGKPYNAVSLLKCIAQYGTEQQKALAKAFIPIFEKTDIKCVFLHKGNDGTAGTTYDTRQDNTYDISFNMDAVKMARNPYQTMLHELVHSLTVNRLRNDETLRNGTIELMEYVRNFLRERGVPESATYNKRGEDYTIALDTYGVHNEREFMAEALANPKFQALLKQIPAPKEPLTAWQKVCSLIAQAFRRLFNIQYKQDTNVYDILVPVIADTMTVTAQQGERGREMPNASWNLERDATMQAMAAEVVSALNVAIEDKDVHWTNEQVMELLGDEGQVQSASVEQVVSLPGYEYFTEKGEDTKVDAAWKIPFLRALDAQYSTENTPQQTNEITDKIEKILAAKTQDEVRDILGGEQPSAQSSPSTGGNESVPTTNINPANYHLVSGAADGSDTIWAEEARKLGMQVTDITTQDWDRLDSETKARYEKYFRDICHQIGRPVSDSKYPRRDLLQADRSDAVFAIGMLQAGSSIVDGGTGYATTRAINTGKPVYLFEQNRGQWLQFNYQTRHWQPTGVPKLTPNAAVIGTRRINDSGKAAIIGVLNNTLGIEASSGNTATQKPQGNIRKIKPFSLEPVEGQEKQYKLRKNKDITDATADEIKYSIEEMFETGEIPFGVDIIGEQLTEAEIKALDSAACLNKVDISREKAELNRNDIGRWTVGRTAAEIALKQQEDTLLNSTLFGNRELRQLSMLTMFKLSEQISKLQSGEESGEDILGPDFKDVDFTKMSRIDILNKIGLSRLFNEVIKERIFNFKLNPALKKNRTLMKKATLIKDNFDAFIRMGYDNLIEREHVAPTGVINGIKSDTDSAIQNEDGEDLSEEEIQEIFGSSVEAWQTGFRQMSTFTNLTKLIRERLDRLYELDDEGNKVVNEWGIEKNIDSHEAVTKILKWTQGATDIFDMINKLKERQSSNPWVSQLIDILNDDNEEQFRSQFYSNFKKYFQPYHVIYKKKDKNGFERTVITMVNKDSFIKNTLDTLSSLDNSGKLTIYDGNTHKFNQQALGVLAGARDAIAADLGNMTDAGVESVMNAFKVLNIPVPAKEDMARILEDIDKAIAIKNALSYIYRELNANSKKALDDDYRVLHAKNDSKGLKDTKSDYESLTRAIADAMSDGLESVSYEAGKLHYSFVTPSYLSSWVESMKGKKGDFEEFVKKQYGNVVGWFYNPEQHENQQGPEGWLNYWLAEMMDDTVEADRLRKIFDHTVVLSDNGVAYADKSPAQYLASLMQMYLYDNEGRTAWFRMPMMSNKQSEEYLRFARIHYNGYTDGYKDVILDWLCEKTIYQEINRIRAVNARKALPDVNKIANFDKNGTRFYFLPMLNKYLSDDSTLGKLLRKKIAGEKFDETQNETNKFRTLVRDAIKEGINAKYDLFKRTLNEEGIIELKEGNSDEIEKVNILQDKLDAANANRILEEFFWNDMFASINIMQLTIIDPAQYKDTEDLQKRLAQLHSPGMRGNVNATINGRPVTDKFTRTIYIADDVVRSEIIPCLEVIKSRVLSQERYQKNAAAKAMMTKQFDFIIDTFANTNVTDAQAYTSPTGYRKKMAVFGKWTPRDEELYQKIMSGEFNELDLANVWQPLKPFVYSTIEKDGHNDFMPVIKIGVQNKNSEYCLIMADALMRSQGMETKLTALFDFMEASHGLTKGADGKWTGTPNTDGIDTIQFDSTVKVGKTGVMDINDKKIKDGANKGTPVQPYTYKEIMDMFNSLAGKVNGDYNDMWVHKIPFDDYAIQQETPTHFLEHEQQQGSQDRILIWADMPDVDSNGKANMITVNGKPMTVAEAKKQYFEAIARNIERSKQEVIEKFGLQNRSRKLRNVFLSRILQEEILKDSRYGTDLYWACGLNESGEFNIPLSDPIQSDRIQQLLNSIIKNHVNKQMVAGGPVVQVSCYGYSEDLSIRFKDKEGNLLKSFKEYKRDMTKNWKLDGHTEPLPEERVINQYKEYLRVNYASVAYYECYAPIYDKNLLKDFMDKDGNVDVERVRKANPKLLEMIGYRIPTEAKYSMTPLKIVGFMPKSAGEGIMLPKEITALSGSDFDIDKLYIMRYQLDRNDNSREVINSIIEEERLTQKMSGAKFNAREFRQRVNDIINGTVTPESHEQWILDTWNNKHEVTYTEPTEGRNADNNTIIATQWAVLTSALAEDQVLSCGNFEELKRVGYMIAALDNGSKYDSLTGLDAGALKKLAYKDTYLQFADTQMQFHKQNMVAAKLIGVFAQSNVSHAFMNTLGGLQLVFPDKFAFKLDGHTISENLDGEYGYDGTRISSILAQLLAASVDAVKDPVMSKLNISMDTVNAATTLARMGYDLEFIGWFLTHPAIKRLVTRYNNSVAAGNKTSMMKVLHEMQTELVNAGTDIQLDTPDKKDFDKKFFIEDHFRKFTTDQKELDAQKVNDWKVLEMYRRLNSISEALRDVLLMTRFNSITSAVGPFASDTMDNKIKVNGFKSNEWISVKSKIAIQEQPILKAFRQSSTQLEEALLGQNIIQASGVAYAAYKALHDMMGYMSKKMAREFAKFFISYYVNKGDNPVFDLSDEHRAEVLDKFPKEFMSIKADYSDNFLVKNIMMETDQLGRDVLRLYTRGMSDTQLQNLRSAWADLYEDNKFNAFADKDNLAVRLAEYCFFTGSFGFSPKTFISLTPNVVRQALPNYINNCCNYNGMSNGDIMRLVLQFMLNMGYANAGTIEEKDFKKIGDTQVEGKSFPNFEGTIGLARVRDANRNIKYYLLERKPEDENFKYTEVSKLGGANQEAFEIDPSRDITQMQSVIKQQSVEKGSKEEDEGKAPERPVVNNSRLFEQIAQKLGTFNPMSGTKSILETQAEFNRILSNSGADQLAEILGLPSTIISKVADKLNMPSDVLASNAKKVMDEIDLCV